MSEQQNQHKSRESSRDSDLEAIASERHEAMRDRMEREEQRRKDRPEERTEEKALEKASELAEKADTEKATERDSEPGTVHRGAPSKKDLRETFDKQMKEVQDEMGVASRSFSKLVHNPVVETVSDFVDSTLARPNALLSGSIVALIAVTVTYLLAKHYGYRLSGFEMIAAFVAGWLLGIIYDYVSSLLRRKR